MAARSIVLARIVSFMETDSTPRSDRWARRAEARSQGRGFRICFHRALDPEYRVRNRFRQSHPGPPAFVERQEHCAGSSTKGIRKQDVLESVVLALLAAGVAGIAAWYFIPLSFKAEARLQVAAQVPRILFTTADTQGSGGGDDYKRFQSTQQTLVLSQLVLGAALCDSKVSRCAMIREQVDPVEWLQQKIKVDFISGSEVMEIALTGSDPEDLAIIVNAVKQAYMDEVVNVDARRRAERHEQLRKLRESYASHLKEKRDHMRKLAETVGSNDQATLVLLQQDAREHVRDLSTQRFRLRLEQSEVETVLRGGRKPRRPRPIRSARRSPSSRTGSPSSSPRRN